MTTQARPTEAQIHEIVKDAIDAPDDIPGFSMDGNWYEDYGMDSLGAVALVVEVQKKFKVRLADNDMPNIRTGNQLVEAIVKLQSAATAGEAGATAEASAAAG
ncbi:acyl carrier protein [Ottowia sp.]|uniref:acyl carrier protein n=1 Tax=Ottowia sp. TaxID=1898956 RepID=UPI0025FC9D36|nr:acyl carrier protein [Ottowia sp.]MBK6616482.1 acyl carrier protein [Ottowia sp.]